MFWWLNSLRRSIALLNFITGFNMAVFIIFITLYAYQFIYLISVFVKKPQEYEAKKQHKFAVVSSARNEEAVIGNFIDSVKKQKYPGELVDIFIIADNCTDNTAKIARQHGAYVLERFNDKEVGKGYALDYFFDVIKAEYADNGYEAFIFFDADNLLDENYVAEMNKVFDNGYRAITSYRNSKNYGSNWISAGYALWFLREAKYLNNARMLLGTSCAISGTGFLLSKELVEENDGWKYHLLTEDIQFSVANILQKEKIGYCGKAKLYDEQPYTFSQSWKQRMRWCKGFYQVVMHYGFSLFKNMFRNFACFDMLMTILPAIFLTFISVIVNCGFIVLELIQEGVKQSVIPIILQGFGMSIVYFYLILFFFGVITTITEWKEIHCPVVKRILYCFTFPIFIFTYIPISVAALFKKVKWEPIKHDVNISIESLSTKTKHNE